MNVRPPEARLTTPPFLKARPPSLCGINPGGEVKGVEIDPARMARCPESYRMRLMDREEATGMKAVWG